MEHSQRLLAAQYRLAQHYLDKLRTVQRVYQQGNENEGLALAMFDRERDQVKHWQAWASHHAAHDQQAAALCNDYARACPNIFKLRLLPREYLTWLEAALEAAHQLKDRHAEAAHLLEICKMSNIVIEYPHTINYAQQALIIARQIDDQRLVAQALQACGLAARNQGNYGEARGFYEQSLSLYRAINDRRGMAELFDELSVIAFSLRNNAAALNYLEQCLPLLREIGNQEGLGICLNNLGYLAIRLGNYSAATDYLKQSLALSRIIGNKYGTFSTLMNLGTCAYYQGDYAVARNYFEQVLDATRANGIREQEAVCLYKLGQVTMAQGELLMTRDYFEQSLIFSRSTTTGTLLPETLGNLAVIYLLLHQETLASSTLRESLEAASNFAVLHIRFWPLVAAARMWIIKGKPLQAARWMGMIENHPHPAVKMSDLQRDIQVARAECASALSPEQFAAAWEEGKTLDADTVIADILRELMNSNNQSR